MTDAIHPERPDGPELPEHIYAELRVIARRLMRNQGQPDTMQATALLHEAWLRLLGSPPKEAIKNRVAMLRTRCATCWWTAPGLATPNVAVVAGAE